MLYYGQQEFVRIFKITHCTHHIRQTIVEEQEKNRMTEWGNSKKTQIGFKESFGLMLFESVLNNTPPLPFWFSLTHYFLATFLIEAKLYNTHVILEVERYCFTAFDSNSKTIKRPNIRLFSLSSMILPIDLAIDINYYNILGKLRQCQLRCWNTYFGLTT